MHLPFASLLVVLLNAPSHDAFSTTPNSVANIIRQNNNLIATTASQTQLSAEKDGEGGGDGWFDDYDDFVGKLDFEGGGWDSGADAPFEGSTRNGDRGDNSRGRGAGRGGGGRGRGGYGGERGGYDGGGGGNYGTTGHDYERDARDGTSPVDEAKVNELLASRLNYRKKRLFDAADDMRDELLNVHGVTVWDRDKTWTTSKGGGGGGGGGRGDGGGDRFDGGGRGGRSGRGSGRGRGRERQFNEFGHDYSQAGGPIDPEFCTLAPEEIHDMIKERMECKFARDFHTADRIQADLQGSGVEVDDGTKEWRADGESWGRSNRRDRDGGGGWEDRGPKITKVYYQRGPGRGLSEETIETISGLVAERSEAKATTDYNRADEIFDRLSDEFSVNVDDKRGEWALLDEEYLLSSDGTSSFVPDEDVQLLIGKKLGERILARKSRNFDLADDIRDELREEYVVEIDDRDKTWIVVAPEGARWSDDEEDGQGDDNIVSKQEWDNDEDEEEKDNAVVDSFDDSTEGDAVDDDEVSVIEEKDDSLDESVLMKLTVPVLKEKLREAKLPVSGKKSELIERLIKG